MRIVRGEAVKKRISRHNGGPSNDSRRPTPRSALLLLVAVSTFFLGCTGSQSDTGHPAVSALAPIKVDAAPSDLLLPIRAATVGLAPHPPNSQNLVSEKSVVPDTKNVGDPLPATQNPAEITSPIKGQDTLKPTSNNSPLDIKLETSRAQPTVGSGLGVQAIIKNASDVDIYVNESSVVLILPPELSGRSIYLNFFPGLFATHHLRPDKDNTKDIDDANVRSDIVIKPGDVYLVDWQTGDEDYSDLKDCEKWPSILKHACPYTPSFVLNTLHIVTTEFNFIFFNPGDYKISIIAQYWTSPGFKPNEYHTATQATTVRVAAPQSVILFGAALGGLIGFFIFPLLYAKRRPPRTGKTRAKTFAGLLGAMLLSMIVTILLARISETQFLIRVTVADFWGAIAVGFVANYIGVKIFEKILPSDKTTAPRTESPRAGNPPRTRRGRSANGAPQRQTQ